MTRHKHADVMIAYANDTSIEIEYYDFEDDRWFEVNNPFWFENSVYRIKPKKAEKGDFICEIDGKKWYLGPEADKRMTWDEAKEWAEKQGCMLPPREVLLMCYIKEDIRKQFNQEWYWSSGECYNEPARYAWGQLFDDGFQYNGIKDGALYARGVFCE